MNKLKLVVLFLLFVSAAHSAEITIRATVGDRATQLAITSAKSDYLLTHSVNGEKKAHGLLGKHNFEYTKAQILKLTTGKGDRGADCHRDYTSVEYRDDSGKVSKADLCLLAETPKSQNLRMLVKVLLMALY